MKMSHEDASWFLFSWTKSNHCNTDIKIGNTSETHSQVCWQSKSCKESDWSDSQAKTLWWTGISESQFLINSCWKCRVSSQTLTNRLNYSAKVWSWLRSCWTSSLHADGARSTPSNPNPSKLTKTTSLIYELGSSSKTEQLSLQTPISKKKLWKPSAFLVIFWLN